MRECPLVTGVVRPRLNLCVLTCMSEDYYSVLGVPKKASKEEIQKAYRNLARKSHPDLNPDDPGAKKKFQKLQEAFDVLGNEEKRKTYDQYGSVFPGHGLPGGEGHQGNSFSWGAQGSPFPGGQGSRSHGGGKQAFNIADILEMLGVPPQGAAAGRTQGGNPFESMESGGSFHQFFNMENGGTGSGSSQRSRRRSSAGEAGADILQTITIPFIQAIQGGKTSLSIQRSKRVKPETVSFTIPAGVEDGKKIRLRGLGHPGVAGGRPGNLIVEVRVEPHPQFQRRGRNLLLSVPITLKEAVFGAKVDIPSPQGKVTLSIPSGSVSGMKLRIKGCGVPVSSVKDDSSGSQAAATAGDLIAELAVLLPRKWSTQDLELLRKLETQEQIDVRHHLRWK